MVKEISSRYMFNARRMGWWKVKPEYGSGNADHVDLVVVGAYYADT